VTQATSTGGADAPETYDVSSEQGVERLHKNAVGLIGVLFLTVTGAAPMTAMLGNVPFAAGFGNGIYVAASFLLATIVLTIFSIGYAQMAKKVTSVGGFYSFISMGLGRELGMSAGLASLAAYSVFEASLCGIFAYFANATINTYLGVDIPWIYLAFFMIFFVSVLSYLDVQLSAAVLGVALVLEVLILLVFNISVMMANSGTNFNLEALNILGAFNDVAARKVGDVEIAAGAAAVGIFMAFWSWVGFEMAPNYAEESQDPKRIIPRSLYISVIGLGLFYIWTSLCAVSAYPTEDEMLLKATKDSSNFFITPIEQFAGPFWGKAMNLLILTSAFACGMAFHNTAARYMYSLAREGVLPGFLGNTHDRWKSPHVASVAQSVLAALWVGLFAYYLGADNPNDQAYLGVYTLLAILGTMLLLILQAIVSIAIIVYFRVNHPGEGGFISTFLAPLIAFFAQAGLVYLLVTKLDAFGGVGGFGANIPFIALGIFVVGLVWGLLLRFVAPDTHARIGRVVYNE
jgi:amino acid transporter